MSKQDTVTIELPLGGVGETLTWNQFEEACEYAKKFASALDEPVDPVKRAIWRKERGLLRKYGDLPGPPGLDPGWTLRCFQQGLIGIDPNTRWVMRAVGDCANVDSPVIIRGDTGTGKEVVARCIHYLGSRSKGPFIAVNCAGIPDALLESELFGHKRGAFTDAKADRKGKFEQAGTGTIFLDEIGDMPAYLQAKVLRVLQDRVVDPVGATAPGDTVDVRVLAATNKDLDEQMRKGQFRKDLYYRLNTMEINLLPLYLRPADLPLLLFHFITEYNQRYGAGIAHVTQGLLEELMLHRWPGNARELQSLVHRSCNFVSGRADDAETLPSLDLQHAIPALYLRKRESGKELAHHKKVTLSKLRAFDSYQFMQGRDRYLAASSQRRWTMEHRSEVLRREHSGDDVQAQRDTRQPAPDVFELLAERYEFKEVERRYVLALLQTAESISEASKRSGMTRDKIRKLKGA